MIFLDHNATTPIWPQVAEEIRLAFERHQAHPQSAHAAGRQALASWEAMQLQLFEQLGADGKKSHLARAVFATSGTAANRMALFQLMGNSGGRLLVSAAEHPSILDVASELRSAGCQVEEISVKSDGRVDLESLENMLKHPAQCVAIQWANHETGVIQPLAQAQQICQNHGVTLHVDAVQAIGKIPCHFLEQQLNSLVLSAHKFGGPRGIAIWVAQGDLLSTGQFEAIQGGTPPLELLAGLNKALQLANQAEQWGRIQVLRDDLESALTSGYPDAIVHGANSPRTHQTIAIAFPPIDRQAMLMALDLAGVCCSAGAACASGSSEPAPTLIAMGVPQAIVQSSIRLSLGQTSTLEDVQKGAQIILETAARLRDKCSV
jgi:cysteine desulfurase